MSLYPTDLHVVSQTMRDLVVVDPPYFVSSIVFAVVGLLLWAGGFVAGLRVGFSRPPVMVLWGIPFLFGTIFLVGSVLVGQTSWVTLSSDTGTLSMRKSVLSIRTGAQEYRLDQVKLVRVGVGDGCLFLYVSLVDRPAEDLTSCTDRTGYGEMADAMNAFLDAHRH